jgi:hypothetical protein
VTDVEGASDDDEAERDIIRSGRDSLETRRVLSICEVAQWCSEANDLHGPKRKTENIRDITSHDAHYHAPKTYKGPVGLCPNF